MKQLIRPNWENITIETEKWQKSAAFLELPAPIQALQKKAWSICKKMNPPSSQKAGNRYECWDKLLDTAATPPKVSPPDSLQFLDGHQVEIFVKDDFLKISSAYPAPKGLAIRSFSEIYQDASMTKMVSQLLLEQVLKSPDPIKLMQLANLKKGFFLQVKKTIAAPLILHFIDEQKAALNIQHALYLIEPDTEVKIYQKNSGWSSFRSTFIYLFPKSILHHATLLKVADCCNQWEHTEVIQEEKSKFTAVPMVHATGYGRQLVKVTLKGEKAKATLLGGSQVDKEGVLEQQVDIHHQVDGGESEQHYKGLVFKKSKAILQAKVEVNKQTKNNASKQYYRGFVVDPTAKIIVEPYLRIWTDEVKCSHGVALAPLPAAQLFYGQSRGLSKKEVEKLFLSDFFSETIQQTKNKKWASYLHKIFAIPLLSFKKK